MSRRVLLYLRFEQSRGYFFDIFASRAFLLAMCGKICYTESAHKYTGGATYENNACDHGGGAWQPLWRP